MAKIKIIKPFSGALPDHIKNVWVGIEIPYVVPEKETYNYQVDSALAILELENTGNMKAAEYYKNIVGTAPIGFPKKVCIVCK